MLGSDRYDSCMRDGVRDGEGVWLISAQNCEDPLSLISLSLEDWIRPAGEWVNVNGWMYKCVRNSPISYFKRKTAVKLIPSISNLSFAAGLEPTFGFLVHTGFSVAQLCWSSYKTACHSLLTCCRVAFVNGFIAFHITGWRLETEILSSYDSWPLTRTYFNCSTFNNKFRRLNSDEFIAISKQLMILGYLITCIEEQE